MALDAEEIGALVLGHVQPSTGVVPRARRPRPRRARGLLRTLGWMLAVSMCLGVSLGAAHVVQAGKRHEHLSLEECRQALQRAATPEEASSAQEMIRRKLSSTIHELAVRARYDVQAAVVLEKLHEQIERELPR